VNLKIIGKLLDFKFSPCSESCMFSFGYFPGGRLSFADVSEPSVRSISKGSRTLHFHRTNLNNTIIPILHNKPNNNKTLRKNNKLTFWHRNLAFKFLAHPVCKMWIIQEPKKVATWNKRHIEEKKNWACAACLKKSVRIFVEKIQKMGCLESSGVPVLYIGRTVRKG
jgi:hypothetical protein